MAGFLVVVAGLVPQRQQVTLLVVDPRQLATQVVALVSTLLAEAVPVAVVVVAVVAAAAAAIDKLGQSTPFVLIVEQYTTQETAFALVVCIVVVVIAVELMRERKLWASYY